MCIRDRPNRTETPFKISPRRYVEHNTIMYTDNLKTENGVDSVFVDFPRGHYPRWRVCTLPNFMQCGKFFDTVNTKVSRICTYTEYVLMNLYGSVAVLEIPGSVDPLLQQLMELRRTLDNLDLSFAFVQCLGNVGIQGKRKAEATARNALNSLDKMELTHDLRTQRCV